MKFKINTNIFYFQIIFILELKNEIYYYFYFRFF